MTNPKKSPEDDESCSDVSIDSDVAFAFIDFSGVDFGEVDEPTKKSLVEHEDPLQVEPSASNKAQDNAEKYNADKRQSPQQKVEMPDGQQLIKRETHDPQLFQAQTRRVENLCKWYELGIRPSLSSSSLLNLAAHDKKDDDLFEAKVDDLQTLLLRTILAQDDLNTNLPPHPLGEYEASLKVAPSTIEGAGNGLFATAPIPKGAIVCNYTGYRHHYQSQKRLKDRAYILKLQNGWPKHDRKNDGFVDALPTRDVLARFIKDIRIEEECNVKFEHIQEPGIWHCPVVAQRDIAAGEELFISYGPRYWSESRMIGG